LWIARTSLDGIVLLHDTLRHDAEFAWLYSHLLRAPRRILREMREHLPFHAHAFA
jgi:hypothetical protein